MYRKGRCIDGLTVSAMSPTQLTQANPRGDSLASILGLSKGMRLEV